MLFWLVIALYDPMRVDLAHIRDVNFIDVSPISTFHQPHLYIHHVNITWTETNNFFDAHRGPLPNTLVPAFEVSPTRVRRIDAWYYEHGHCRSRCAQPTALVKCG